MIRWLLWNVRCLRGRLCADMQVLGVESIEGYMEPPPGSFAVVNWQCAGCKTNYSRSVLIGEDGVFTPSDRLVVR